MPTGTSLLGQLLLKAKLITEKQLEEAIKIQKQNGKRLGSILVELGYISEEILITFLSKQYNVPAINLPEYKIDTSLLRIIPYNIAKKYQLIPIFRDGTGLRIAIADPSNSLAIDDVRFLSGMKVSVHVSSESAILEAIEKYYIKKDSEVAHTNGVQGKGFIEVEDLNRVIGSALEDITIVEEKEEKETLKEIDAPIVRLTNGILTNAINSNASDIHIEPAENAVRVRYRIDGTLHPVLELPTKIKNAVTSRLKILANLDISERRLPQISHSY